MVNIKKNIFSDIIEIKNFKEYNKKIKEYSQFLILIYYYDNLCNSNQILEKIKNVRNNNINNNLVFFKINVSDNKEIVSNIDITSTPVIYFYKNLEKIKSIYGTYENIEEILNKEIFNVL